MNCFTERLPGTRAFLMSFLVLLPWSVPGKPIVVKMATLAPEGSPWHELLVEMGQGWHDATGGEVVLRIYPGGVAGDERDVIRKIRIKQLHAAAVTIEGLTAISRDMNVFYIPLLVQSFEELDFIRSNLLDDLTEDLDSQGFMILGWADVGWAYWFSRKPILTPEDLKDLRLFSWAGDYRWVELWKKAGFHPVPLASVDLLPSLQTGLVDAFATAPMVALSKQWFGPAPHMLDLKWGPMIGAIIISTKMWESIPAAYHPLLLEIARETEIRARDLLPLVQEALDVMNEYGLQIHRPSGDQQKAWIDLTHAFYPDIRGVLVPEEVFDRAIELKREWDERKRGTPEAPSPGN